MFRQLCDFVDWGSQETLMKVFRMIGTFLKLDEQCRDTLYGDPEDVREIVADRYVRMYIPPVLRATSGTKFNYSVKNVYHHETDNAMIKTL